MPRGSTMQERSSNDNVQDRPWGAVRWGRGDGIPNFSAGNGYIILNFGLVFVQSRDEIILEIPMGPVGPMGFPWEWESLG